MSKSTWQVIAGVAGMACVGLVFALGVTRHELTDTKIRLAEARDKPAEVHETIVREPCYQAAVEDLPLPEGAVCRGGVVLRRTAQGWDSIMAGGRAMRCKP